ncbi:MAG: ASKHA domain-containing protein [Deltaproteobacteria bacterium]|jgi:uncharacterized 2Fe-2S/4Fe-4S cluster protein (DUF4445 family)/ferredoxin|nr:ASKHA domain-containing protein [Deltaproteobacteria bacterium]
MLICVRTADGAPGTWFSIRAKAGQTWAQAVYLSGIFAPPALCSGLGRCGHCRLRLLAGPAEPPSKREISILGLENVAEGWLLGCLHQAADGLYLELPPGVALLPGAQAPDSPTDAPRPAAGPGPAVPARESGAGGPGRPGREDEEVSLALDFGTTSLVWAEVDAAGNPVAPEQMINPQMGGGSDVISRLALAAGPAGNLAGRRGLQSLALKALSLILRGHSEKGGRKIREVVLAANPAMTYLLLGVDPSGLAAAPYRLDYKGGETVRLPGLPGFSGPAPPSAATSIPPLWVCPLVSPFIGGDASAGYAWLHYGQEAKFPFLLADMGTNGEFILALDEHRALAASVPLGPALEGMGMNCGALAGPGVITGFELTAAGLLPKFGRGRPSAGEQGGSGISGTGYLDLLRHLVQLGLMDESGQPVRFDAEQPAGAPASPDSAAPAIAKNSSLYRRLAGAFGIAPQGGETAWYIDGNLYISTGDVEEMLKVKAAFRLALKLLLREAGLDCRRLTALYISGALGSHVAPECFTALGFAPQGLAGRISGAGNTSLAGAALLAGRRRVREKLLAWCGKVVTLNLAESAEFQRLFTGEMHLGIG